MSILKIKNESGKWVYIPTIRGEKGDKGDPGVAGQPGEKGDPGTPGAAGKDGADGYSPSAKVETVTGGAKITITDKDGTTTATVTNGKDGAAGQPGEKGDPGTPGAAGKDGADGYSPSAKVEAVTGGAKITITDKDGTTTATVTNGKDGAAGQPGEKGDPGTPGAAGKDGVDGVSPTAKVQAVTGGAKITITDKDGTTTATVTNGTNGSPGAAGKDGADGYSPSATVTQTSTGATITITDANGTTTANITNGAKGDPGDDYVLTAQDKTDIAEIVAENGLFYETHCNGQVFNVSNPGATWVNTDGTMDGLQARRYVFDADGAQDVVQLSRVYDSSVENYCYTGTSETLGITLTYYYSNTLINQSHIEFSNNVSKFKMYIYSSTALVELKTRHNIGRVFANNILSLIGDYYDNGDTSYYG